MTESTRMINHVDLESKVVSHIEKGSVRLNEQVDELLKKAVDTAVKQIIQSNNAKLMYIVRQEIEKILEQLLTQQVLNALTKIKNLLINDTSSTSESFRITKDDK